MANFASSKNIKAALVVIVSYLILQFIIYPLIFTLGSQDLSHTYLSHLIPSSIFAFISGILGYMVLKKKQYLVLIFPFVILQIISYLTSPYKFHGSVFINHLTNGTVRCLSCALGVWVADKITLFNGGKISIRELPQNFRKYLLGIKNE